MLEAVVADQIGALGAFAGARAAEDEDDGDGLGGEGWGFFGRGGEFGIVGWGVKSGHDRGVVILISSKVQQEGTGEELDQRRCWLRGLGDSALARALTIKT